MWAEGLWVSQGFPAGATNRQKPKDMSACWGQDFNLIPLTSKCASGGLAHRIFNWLMFPYCSNPFHDECQQILNKPSNDNKVGLYSGFTNQDRDQQLAEQHERHLARILPNYIKIKY